MMTYAAVVLIVLMAAVGLIWLSRHIMINRELAQGFILTGEYAGPPKQAPLLSVVVSAKDEEANIETCVRSMLQQDYPNFEMIVVNDRSTDRTAEIVEKIVAEDSRLRLINIADKPEGWCGKNFGMQTGIKAAKGDWLVMIDADCRQTSNRTLSVALQYAQDKQSDLLSILPLHQLDSFWEEVVQPVGSGLMMIWFHPDKVNDPARPNAYANGAFMLMKRQAYQQIGTHEAVCHFVNEDMHMADLVKKAGLKLRVVRNNGLYSIRMYSNFEQIIRGWSRIFFGTFGTLKRLIISLAVLLFVSILPYIVAPLGLVLAGLGAQGAGLWLTAGLIALASVTVQTTVIWRFYRIAGARASLAWSYLLGCGIIVYALLIAISKLRKGAQITWRGTSYPSSTK